jgi:extracellular elastinolytic metalloproteinase
LTGPNQGKPYNIALDYLNKHLHSLGITQADLNNMVVKDKYVTKHNGVTHIYLRQQYDDIEVFSGDISINIAADGSVINVNNHFVPNLANAINRTKPSISPFKSVEFVAQHFNQTITTDAFMAQTEMVGPAMAVTLSGGDFSMNSIPVKLMYQPIDGGKVRLVWSSETRFSTQDWWVTRVDAETGEVLSKNNRVVSDNDYKVFPVPYVSPEDPGVSHSLINMPADDNASPYGWHDTNGAPGAEYTDTRGNNVFAQEDWDCNDTNGFRPDGGVNLIFDFPWDSSDDPQNYVEASVSNLFYWNNIIHDIFYHYGFDEVSGNFQKNNYDKGGLGNDAVQADAQDGADCLKVNNANFATPPDGQAPRMQMYLWDITNPKRDGDFENGIVIHEYGHGISNRLTGGPSADYCLLNGLNGWIDGEQMGEGWSDWLAMILTTKASDTSTTARGIGPYVLGEAPDGHGLRPARYSTNMMVNPYTYGDISWLVVPHEVGFVWATMQWALISKYGFDPDLYSGTGGNNIAIQLVIDGMKLQPCFPGFVDGRDAILLADQNNNGGENQCLIWEAFAKRGLGYSADQGDSFSSTDGTEAFDMSPDCLNTLKINQIANKSPAGIGAQLEYTLKVRNDTLGTLTGVIITDELPANTTYVQNSATCGGSENNGTIIFPIGTMNSGDSNTCTFQVKVNRNISNTMQLFVDDMENGADKWTVSHGLGSIDWILNNTNPNSGSFAWFAEDVGYISDQYLTMTNPVMVAGINPTLRFWHNYETEHYYDGGVVEISTDGGIEWQDLDSKMIQNGYNSMIWTDESPIGYRNAFSGNSGGYVETLVNLSAYNGQNVQIRFRMATDTSGSGNGWFVDDVELIADISISNTACVSAEEGDSDCDSVTTPVEPALNITNTANSSSIKKGGKLEYTLKVYNDTSETLTGVTVTDNVLADTTYVSDSATCGGSENDGTVSFPLGTMESGDSSLCTFQVQVSHSHPSTPISNTACVSAEEGDSDCGSVTTTVKPLSVTLSSFNAVADEGKVTLNWETGTEKSNAGFVILRSQPLEDGKCSDKQEHYTDKAIPPLVYSKGDEVSGATYTETDSNVVSGNTYCYALEDVDYNGNKTIHEQNIVSVTVK